MRVLALVVFLTGCASPFEGHFTGTVVEVFECNVNGGSSRDVALDWTISEDSGVLVISGEAGCQDLRAAAAGDSASLRPDGSCPTSVSPDGIRNTTTFERGLLTVSKARDGFWVDMWRRDQGSDVWGSWDCTGQRFGKLTRVD